MEQFIKVTKLIAIAICELRGWELSTNNTTDKRYFNIEDCPQLCLGYVPDSHYYLTQDDGLTQKGYKVVLDIIDEADEYFTPEDINTQEFKDQYGCIYSEDEINGYEDQVVNP